MDIIDELYYAYGSMDYYNAYAFFDRMYAKYDFDDGTNSLIDALNDFVKNNSNKFPSMFATYKNKGGEDKKIEDIVTVFSVVAECINELLGEYRLQEDEKYNEYLDDEFDDYEYRDQEYFEEINRRIKEHDLFTISKDLIKDAFNKYGNRFGEEVTQQEFNQFLALIELVRKNDSLNKCFGSNDWQCMDFKQVLYSLYDYHKQNEKMFTFEESVGLDSRQEIDSCCNPLFKKISYNCSRSSVRSFDQYRTALISRKNALPNLNKLAFCINLLEYYRSGIMPFDGYLDMNMTDYDDTKPIKDLNRIYSSKFDYEKFVKLQANCIYDPNLLQFSAPNQIEKVKATCKDNSLAIGFLLSSMDMFSESNKVYYLIHIYLKDFTNDLCTYEIQFNVVPQGKLKSRIQLLRLDNWETKQVHKNIGKKLETSTHIHLYNHFDILRGKRNASYDIAYNLSDNNIEFDKALLTFLDIIDIDVELIKKISATVDKIRKQCIVKAGI